MEYIPTKQKTPQRITIGVRSSIQRIQYFFRQYMVDMYPGFTPRPDMGDISVDMWDHYSNEICNGYIIVDWVQPAPPVKRHATPSSGGQPLSSKEQDYTPSESFKCGIKRDPTLSPL